MPNDTTTSNASKVPIHSSSSQQTATQVSQLGHPSSTHSIQPGTGPESASFATQAQDFPGDDSGEADNEHSPDDGKHSDQDTQGRVATSEKGEPIESDMDEFERLEALAVQRASKMESRANQMKSDSD
jgi:hypothetical protein